MSAEIREFREMEAGEAGRVGEIDATCFIQNAWRWNALTGEYVLMEINWTDHALPNGLDWHIQRFQGTVAAGGKAFGCFDGKTDRRFLALREELKARGYCVPEWPPHITIAAYEDLSESLLVDWTSAFAGAHGALRIGLRSMSILPPGGEHPGTAVLCAAPAYAKEFVDFYYAFHAKHEAYCTGIGRFNAISHGNPVIHATIAVVPVDKMQSATDCVLASDVFAAAEIRALEVYTYPCG